MDVLGVRQVKSQKRQSKSRNSNKKDDIKVVYISSPMKVKTCASRFRALVQELTGKDSDVGVPFMDSYGGGGGGSSSENSPSNSEATTTTAGTRGVDDDDRAVGLPMGNYNREFSVFEPFDDGLMTEGSFLGMFTSNLLNDPSQLDAIRSFDSV